MNSPRENQNGTKMGGGWRVAGGGLRATRNALLATVLALGLGGASSSSAQVLWNFGTATPTSGVPTGLTIGAVSQGNNNGTTTLLTTTSASSGYTGASGGNNAGAAARVGVLNTGTSGSAYFEFTITPDANYSFTISGISLGSRGTTTGPTAYSIRSSADSYASDLATGTLTANSAWILRSNTGLNINRSVATTYRIYGYGGTGSAGSGTANWRIDDLSLTIIAQQMSAGTPVITSSTTPSGTAYSSFTYQITADNAPTSFGATGLPSELSINTVTGAITGTITTPGTYPFTVSATNGSGTGSAIVTLTVVKNPGAPTITSALTATGQLSNSFSYQIVADNTPTSYAASNLPTGITVDTTNGLISGTPTVQGVRNVLLTASNSLGIGTNTLVLTINAPPVFNSALSGSAYPGGVISNTISASGTPTPTYSSANLLEGLTIVETNGVVSGTLGASVLVGTNTFTVTASNSVGTTSATYSLVVLDQAAQDAIPLNVVINKFVNASPDRVELLVIGDGTVGSTVDMRGMIIKDTSGSMANDGGGKFIFTNDTLWSAVRAGTLIVLTAGTTQTEDLVVGGNDFKLEVNLGNTTYFTSGGGSFDIATTEMVVLKAAGTGVDGIAGGIHALASGSAGALYTAFTGKKLRATTTTGTNLGAYANNDTAALADFNPTTDGTGATGNTAAASLTFGSPNPGAGNDNYIKALRGSADGTGLATVANRTAASPLAGMNIFARAASAQTVEITYTPTSTTKAITQLSIAVPVDFGAPVQSNVTFSGSASAGATATVSGQTVTVSGFSALNPNTLVVRIAGLTTPDTSLSVSSNGSYTFTVSSAETGGTLSALGASPQVLVTIPLANVRNNDANGVSLMTNRVVAVQGVCTVDRIGSGSTSTILQEASHGVSVYSLSAIAGPQIRGNSYVAVGSVANFNGLSQLVLSNTNQHFLVNMGSSTEPTPLNITAAQLNAGEIYESRLARITATGKVSGTWASGQIVVMTDGSSNFNVRIQSASSATAEPTNFPVTLTGIVGQSDTTSPFDSGYQLQPRDVNDAPAAPTITSTAFAGTVGVVFSNKISSLGSPVITASNGLPAGLSLDSATGWITGTPTSAATNGVAFGFVATNAYGTNNASITFTIAKGTPTVASAPTASAINEGQTLASSLLTGGSATGIGSTALSGTFGWNSPTFVPPLGTANYGVVFTPSGADADNWNVSGNVNVSVTVNAASGSTFDGAYPGKNLTEVAPNGLTYLVNYAFGGDANTAATLPVLDNGDPTKLRLIVVVRTDDTSLTVGGQVSSSLTEGWSSAGVTVTDADDQTGLPANTARKVVSVDRGSDPKKFIRVAVTK